MLDKLETLRIENPLDTIQEIAIVALVDMRHRNSLPIISTISSLQP